MGRGNERAMPRAPSVPATARLGSMTQAGSFSGSARPTPRAPATARKESTPPPGSFSGSARPTPRAPPREFQDVIAEGLRTERGAHGGRSRELPVARDPPARVAAESALHCGAELWICLEGGCQWLIWLTSCPCFYDDKELERWGRRPTSGNSGSTPPDRFR